MVKAAAVPKAAAPSVSAPDPLTYYTQQHYKTRSLEPTWQEQIGTVTTGGYLLPSHTVNYCNAVPGAATFDASTLIR